MKVTDYPSATVIDNTDTMYLIQTSGTAKISKKVAISKLFEKFNIKSIFQKGINYGTTPLSLTNTGTIDLNYGIISLSCTQNSSFVLPSGVQGDELIVLVENNPAHLCILTGTFATGSEFDVGMTGSSARFIFHYGKWYNTTSNIITSQPLS